MSNDYLWDRSGAPELDTKQLEELLAPLAHDAPFDELRLAKGRRGEPVRATAREPVARPTPPRRVKGNVNVFEKRIIGTATLVAVAIGLVGVVAYKRHLAGPETQPDSSVGLGPAVALGRSFAMTPHLSPVAPENGGDLAIVAGESAWIHAPVGFVEVEIQSTCNAEVQIAVGEGVSLKPGPHPGDPPTVSTGLRGGFAKVITGSDRADGRASSYHLGPGIFEYTSQCVGRAPIRGNLVVDRDDGHGRLGSILTNARVFSDETVTLGKSVHVFGTVLPGAIVSIDARPLALGPDLSGYELPIELTFSTDVPVLREHFATAVRVDDAKGTHFYVIHASEVLVDACATKIAVPRQTAAKLDAQGDHAGALRALQTAIEACKPDRDTLSLALTYACESGDADAARSYWCKLPAELQSTLEPVCARNNITRDALDKR
jgi:hypothetical protein